MTTINKFLFLAFMSLCGLVVSTASAIPSLPLIPAPKETKIVAAEDKPCCIIYTLIGCDPCVKLKEDTNGVCKEVVCGAVGQPISNSDPGCVSGQYPRYKVGNTNYGNSTAPGPINEACGEEPEPPKPPVSECGQSCNAETGECSWTCGAPGSSCCCPEPVVEAVPERVESSPQQKSVVQTDDLFEDILGGGGKKTCQETCFPGSGPGEGLCKPKCAITIYVEPDDNPSDDDDEDQENLDDCNQSFGSLCPDVIVTCVVDPNPAPNEQYPNAGDAVWGPSVGSLIQAMCDECSGCKPLEVLCSGSSTAGGEIQTQCCPEGSICGPTDSTGKPTCLADCSELDQGPNTECESGYVTCGLSCCCKDDEESLCNNSEGAGHEPECVEECPLGETKCGSKCCPSVFTCNEEYGECVYTQCGGNITPACQEGLSVPCGNKCCCKGESCVITPNDKHCVTSGKCPLGATPCPDQSKCCSSPFVCKGGPPEGVTPRNAAAQPYFCGLPDPSPEPSAEPTVQPTVEPSVEPTVQPTRAGADCDEDGFTENNGVRVRCVEVATDELQ